MCTLDYLKPTYLKEKPLDLPISLPALHTIVADTLPPFDLFENAI